MLESFIFRKRQKNSIYTQSQLKIDKINKTTRTFYLYYYVSLWSRCKSWYEFGYTNTPVKSRSKKESNKILGYKIEISDSDWQDLKNKKHLCILFAVNTVNEEISYAFPQFEQKPSPLYSQSLLNLYTHTVNLDT